MPNDKDLYQYCMNWIKRSKKKQPIESWKRAEKALLIDEEKTGEKSPYLSGNRLLYESLKSYLDQQDPTFDVVPTSAYFGDEFTLKATECDKKYLDYIWVEQCMQKTQSQKLDSALIRNYGCSLLGFDTKKWMPKLSFIKAVKVYPDPDCDGIKEKAKAIAYEEDISVEEFISKYEISDEDIKSVLSKAGNVLTSDEQTALPENVDGKMFKTIKIYHIFAKGDAAVRKTGDENEVPKDKDVKSLVLEESKRYLQFAEGYEKSLFDGEWPYDIDNNEFPINELMFNTVAGDYYSYTDNDHMSRIDAFCDNLMSDIEWNAQLTGRKKFGSSPLGADLSKTDVDDFLNNPKTTYLQNLLDANGNSKIVQVDVGKFEYPLMQAYDMARKARNEASALGELLSNTAESFKDVTAIAVRVQDANAHQRVNRRLSGIFGYEESIREDAVKILEIAHQYVPKYSVVEVSTSNTNELTGEVSVGSELRSLPWQEAILDIRQGGKLIQLGVDAIVGSQLAEFWREGQPQIEFKLSTNVRVKKGSTRDVTQENKAATMKVYYTEVLMPLYEATNRLDLAAEFAKRMGQMAGIEHIDELVPSQEDAHIAMVKKIEAEQIQKETAVSQIQPEMPQQGGQ